jgi:hypothetical protein
LTSLAILETFMVRLFLFDCEALPDLGHPDKRGAGWASRDHARGDEALLCKPAIFFCTFARHAANLRDPFHAARIGRLERGERFDDATANSSDPWEREVSVHPDCEGGDFWQVEWGDSDGGCYVTVFNGPMAEQRARDYFDALKSGRLKVLRDIE